MSSETLDVLADLILDACDPSAASPALTREPTVLEDQCDGLASACLRQWLDGGSSAA